MYSDNFGASWGIVAQNIFSLAYSSQYLRQDYSWYSGSFYSHTCVCLCVLCNSLH